MKMKLSEEINYACSVMDGEGVMGEPCFTLDKADEWRGKAAALEAQNAEWKLKYGELLEKREIWKERAVALEAEVEQLQARLTEYGQLRDRLTDILDQIAVTLKGKPGELEMHGWSDLPELAKQLQQCRKERDFYKAAIDAVPEWMPVSLHTVQCPFCQKRYWTSIHIRIHRDDCIRNRLKDA